MAEINVWAEDPALGVVTNDVTIQHDIQTATAGQTIFTLTEFTVTDSAALSVTVNGNQEYEGALYGWTLLSPTQVQFTEGVDLGSIVRFTLNTIEADPVLDVTADGVSATINGAENVPLQSHLDAMALTDIAALREITGPLNGNIAKVLMSSSFPQCYYWDAASSASDNGISVITPTSISGAGRWILFTPPFMDLLNTIFSSGAPIASRVIFLGDVTIGDGNGGIFYWNPATARSSANGTSIVDPTVSRANQGTGAGVGCYIRISTF